MINNFVRHISHILLKPDWTKFYKVHRMVLKIKEPHITRPMYKRYDRIIKAGKYSIPVRIYPQRDSNTTMIYIHGGGWATENINTYNKTCKNLSIHCKSTVIAIDYSLSPENKFPQATRECYIVVQSILKKMKKVGKKVILIGDSAGGNLCAVVSLMSRDRNALMPNRQILLYPVTYYDYTENSPFKSVHENATDYILTSKRMQEYVTLYANDRKDFINPYFSPLCAKDFSNQPDTLIITAQFDPLRDEGEYFGKMLLKANNNVTIIRMKDVMHGFFVHDRKAMLETYKLINRYIDF
ncbi:MAG: alpha/beta hydrolase [Ruminococcus sp.]|nr:alpha/beta hydrolase [Ruminococcus sp.]